MKNTIKFEPRNSEKPLPEVRPPAWLVFLDMHRTRAGALLAFGGAVGILLWKVMSIPTVSTENATVEAELFPVNSRMMGFVRAVIREEHSAVEKGALLVEFDDVDLQLELSLKKAKLAKAEADLQRARQLLRTDAISHADFELAEAATVLARVDHEATLTKISFTKIKAPTSGVIAKRSVHVGQFVQPGQTLFVIVPESEQRWIRANFKETQLLQMRTGQKAWVRVDAYPGVVWEGRLESLSPSSGSVLSLFPPENASGNFTKVVQRIPARVSVVPQPKYDLRPGMSAEVAVEIPHE